MPSSFDAQSHFESKIKQGSINNQSTIIRFNNQVFEPKTKTVEKGLRRICKDQFSYEDFVEINKLHTEYMKKLRGTLHNKAFLDLVQKAELTGAKVRIAGKIGYVVEERKNSICVVFEDNKKKIYPKKVHNFSIIFEEIEILIFSEELKKGRALK